MLTLVLGGARSGKSRHALALAHEHGVSVVFVATCVPRDGEMFDKVARHRLERPSGWITIEHPADLTRALDPHEGKADAALIDCLTLYLSEALIKGEDQDSILDRVERFCRYAQSSPLPIIVVSNEVGFGIVPETPLGRAFRDLAGSANQIAARLAQNVWLVAAGIPLSLKAQSSVRSLT
ncbi:MAG: bifunctional adenosylcobinamide kinase/adenosylcobinamide-phosphate guanylyltransferase [Elusimicrobia bacterium]|nr:bifunctional adenosylcobinamide kinase/adenosylcobinamide-phosphate guanylyltransferase [Elusimicrobiota bacterium]